MGVEKGELPHGWAQDSVTGRTEADLRSAVRFLDPQQVETRRNKTAYGKSRNTPATPRSNPGNRLQYRRVNGPYTLIMTATGEHKLPFGNLPRLLLAWISTEAVRTQSRELVLGDSLSEFNAIARCL